MRALLLLLAGCDGVFGLTELRLPGDSGQDAVTDVGLDSDRGCITDDFEGSTLDATKWAPFISADGNATVNGGLLRVTVPTQAIEAVGVRSLDVRDLTRHELTVTVRDVIPNQADTLFIVAADSSNYYAMYYNTGLLQTHQIVAAAIRESQQITYDANVHRHWRIVHQVSPNRMLFYTNDQFQTGWALRFSIAEVVPVTQMRIELGAYPNVGSNSDRTSSFDDFQLCPP